MTDDLSPVSAEQSGVDSSPYVLVTISAEHRDPYRASETLRKAVPPSKSPDGWLWLFVRPERRDRFQVMVLMERRPQGCEPLLAKLEALDCGDLDVQEMSLHETVLPPRTPLVQRMRLFGRRVGG